MKNPLFFTVLSRGYCGEPSRGQRMPALEDDSIRGFLSFSDVALAMRQCLRLVEYDPVEQLYGVSPLAPWKPLDLISGLSRRGDETRQRGRPVRQRLIFAAPSRRQRAWPRLDLLRHVRVPRGADLRAGISGRTNAQAGRDYAAAFSIKSYQRNRIYCRSPDCRHWSASLGEERRGVHGGALRLSWRVLQF